MSVFFSIKKIPDLTLNKYSSLEEGDVGGVLIKHRAFLRQVHQLCLASELTARWLYKFDPAKPNGKRLEIFLTFDGRLPDGFEKYIQASPLSAYYELKLAVSPYEADETYQCGRVLIKRERYAESQNASMELPHYYSVNEWEMNDDARLIGLFNLMRTAEKPCAYLVSVKALDLSEKIEEPLGKIMKWIQEHLHQRFDVHAGGGMNMARDENANYSLKRYEALAEDAAANPHFQVNIQAFANDPAYADMLLSAAASEALDEGSYKAVEIPHKGPFSGREILSLPVTPYRDTSNAAPHVFYEALSFWPVFFLLKELSPFCCLPTLYSGETIEMPKETAPDYDTEGLFLGKDSEKYDVFVPIGNLPKHAFLGGVPGSGKTNSMLHIATELHKKFHIPFLIFEPAKKEYRALHNMPGMQDVTIFSPSANTTFPLHINPFQFPKGTVLAEHIRLLGEVFMGAFPLDLPMPILLDRAIAAIYSDKHWSPYMKSTDGLKELLEFPTMSDLYSKLGKIIQETDYSAEYKSNAKSVLEVRIGSLLTREMGDMFDVKESTLAPEEWLTRPAVIELEALGKDQANFATLLITNLIRETLRANPQTGDDIACRHVIFFEEAHNLIGPESEVAQGGEGNPKISATAFIVKMLAEVRALKEAIIIADQLPTKMAPEVIKNTSLKIGHRITAADDRELLGSTMSADGVQLEKMSTFSVGKSLVYYEGLLKPFELTMNKWAKDDSGADKDEWYLPPRDTELLALMKNNKYFADDLKVSWRIMEERLRKEYEGVKSKYENIRTNYEGRVPVSTVEDEFNERHGCLLRALAYRNQNREFADEIMSLCKKILDDIIERLDGCTRMYGGEARQRIIQVHDTYNPIRTSLKQY